MPGLESLDYPRTITIDQIFTLPAWCYGVAKESGKNTFVYCHGKMAFPRGGPLTFLEKRGLGAVERSSSMWLWRERLGLENNYAIVSIRSRRIAKF